MKLISNNAFLILFIISTILSLLTISSKDNYIKELEEDRKWLIQKSNEYTDLLKKHNIEFDNGS
jgi:hypothetical protein